MKVVKNENGQSLVEFAIVLPILLFVVYGVLTLGLLIYAKMLVVISATQACEVAADIVNDSSMTSEEKYNRVQEVAYTYLDAGINGTEREVIIDKNGDDVEVTVNYEFTYIFPLLSEVFGGKSEVTLTYKAVNFIE